MPASTRALFAIAIAALLCATVPGCGPPAAPTDQPTAEQQMKELNEARQREWNNK